MKLEKLGWNDFFAGQFQEWSNKGFAPARVAALFGDRYLLMADPGNLTGRLTGRFKHTAGMQKDLPAVGDWVAVENVANEGLALIHALLERKNAFARKTPISGGRRPEGGGIGGGSTEEQVIAANVDIIFLVCGLDSDFSIRRIERYLTIIQGMNASSVILLNKADLCERVDDCLKQVQTIVRDMPVHPISATQGTGLEAISGLLPRGHTAIFLGSSGVGKSSLVNRLLGETRQKTLSTNESTGKGRHTTTHRQLFVLASGGIIIDTPGLRELQLWASADDLEANFDDVIGLIHQCRFTDCRHQGEPGCAVRQALKNGELRMDRYESYLAQRREIRRLDAKKRQLESMRGRQKRRLAVSALAEDEDD